MAIELRRRKLAKLPFEKKIQMAGELVKLARELKKARKISPEEFWQSVQREKQIFSNDARATQF